MEESYRGPQETEVTAAGAAGAGAILVGIGLALAYLLKKRGDHRVDIFWDVGLTIDAAGNVTQDPKRVDIDVTSVNPHAALWVRWNVTNESGSKLVDFEDFERRIEPGGASKDVAPFDVKRPGNRNPVRVQPGASRFAIKIDRDAVGEVRRGERHFYEYDIWLDRVKSEDPEIVIIRR